VWTDPDQAGLTAYRRSKTVAERAAWDYIERAHGSTRLTTVLPGAIFGPALTADNFGSLQAPSRMLEGRVPRYPSLAFEVVDVRDVADLHIRAMIAPEAEGERLIATGELLWMGEMAAILREQLGPAAARVPAKPMPDLLVRVAAPFNPELRTLLPLLGAQATALLGESPTDAWLAAQTRSRHGGR
jgi:dihydroflavonol-4-reductase